MEMPYIYEEGPKTETRIRFQVGHLDRKGVLDSVLLIFIQIIECIWGSYGEEFVRKTWDFVPI